MYSLAYTMAGGSTAACHLTSLHLEFASLLLQYMHKSAGRIVSAGDYARDAKHSTASNQGPMSRFLRKEAAVPVPGCSAAENCQEGAQAKAGGMPADQSGAVSMGCQSLPQKRTMHGDISKSQHQAGTAVSRHVKMPRKGIGPMDRFVK